MTNSYLVVIGMLGIAYLHAKGNNSHGAFGNGSRFFSSQITHQKISPYRKFRILSRIEVQ